jgi:hypothetical protein
MKFVRLVMSTNRMIAKIASEIRTAKTLKASGYSRLTNATISTWIWKSIAIVIVRF